MTSIKKLVVATGCSSGLGFEAVKKLLNQTTTSYKFILGVRDTARTQAAYDSLHYDPSHHSVTLLQAELSDLRSVKTFAHQALDKIGGEKIDYLLLNAAISIAAKGPGLPASKWCEAYVVNHLSQHYLIHLLREKLVESHTRIIVVSSGAIRNADVAKLDEDLKANSGADIFPVYSSTKFTQLLGAHYWRRHLPSTNVVVAVSPGMIPGTGLGRHWDKATAPDMSSHPDAKSVETGADSLLAAFTRTDLPEDPEQIFLTSWGEWWSKDVYAPSLDKALQDKWCLSLEEIEKEEGL
ncbi:hypothetical protein HDV00_011318 [Rhizophlyctis rosea]|nr:hypothetical protein HDV00_011318 [Rhizophlyctis rosea]